MKSAFYIEVQLGSLVMFGPYENTEDVESELLANVADHLGHALAVDEIESTTNAAWSRSGLELAANKPFHNDITVYLRAK